MESSRADLPDTSPGHELRADIICKVIDNYGDAGVVLRLARELARLAAGRKSCTLRIFTDQPEIFARMGMAASGDTPENQEPYRDFRNLEKAGIHVLGLAGWDLAPQGWDGRPARVVIQAFDAPLPEFYRQALSSPQADSPAKNTGLKAPNFRQPALSPEPGPPGDRRHLLINLEYLSAEEWTVDYHLLPSLSGIPGVDKVFFLPGFRTGTGGLLWSETPPPTSLRRDQARKSLARLLPGLQTEQKEFWLSIFSYEHDYSGLVTALTAHKALTDLAHAGGPSHPAHLSGMPDGLPGSLGEPVVFLAPGRSARGFLEPWEKAGKPFRVITLPFLSQENYDLLIDACDFNIVRGEESLARAALSGTPFLWHAYLQEERHQLVKVQALLEVMKPCFAPDDFALWESAFTAFNDREADLPPARSGTDWPGLLQQTSQEGTRAGFTRFALHNASPGNLARNILGLIAEFLPTTPDHPV